MNVDCYMQEVADAMSNLYPALIRDLVWPNLMARWNGQMVKSKDRVGMHLQVCCEISNYIAREKKKNRHILENYNWTVIIEC